MYSNKMFLLFKAIREKKISEDVFLNLWFVFEVSAKFMCYISYMLRNL